MAPKKGREHIRNHEEGTHEILAGNIAASQKPCIEKADDGPNHSYTETDDDRIGHGRNVVRAEDHRAEHIKVQFAFIEEGIIDNHEDWNNNNDAQENEAHKCHGLIEAKGLAIQFCKVTGGTAGGA